MLARMPVPDVGRFDAFLAVARDNGFEVGRLTKTIHTIPSIEAGVAPP
jgi:hypothetical protein